MDSNDSNIKDNDAYYSYIEEWERLFCSKFYLENIKDLGIKGDLCTSNFRSICWRVFFECFPESPEEWVDAVKSLRNQYDKILDKLYTNPRSDIKDMDLIVNNPLSQSQQSPWNQYFQDIELKSTIEQDVVRTFPEINFFHTKHMQNMMVNILFCYAREFPNISYRQGMHELLAPILYVLHSDQQAYLNVSAAHHLKMDINILLNQNYLEHDAFSLFCQLMEVVGEWYVVNENGSLEYKNSLKFEPFVHGHESGRSSALGVKLIKIHQHLLKNHDPELFTHLEKMEIAPQIYGIRWLRLLFGREFSMQDLLVIWDVIFASGVSLNLADYIFTAMLIVIRDLLLSGDYTSCLKHLMHYPAVVDVHLITGLALHLKDPTKYCKPVLYTSQTLKHIPLYNDQGTGLIDDKLKPVKSFQQVSSSRPKTLSLTGSRKESVCEPSVLDSFVDLENVPNIEPFLSLSSTQNVETEKSKPGVLTNTFRSKVENTKRSQTLPRSLSRNRTDLKEFEVKTKSSLQRLGKFESENSSKSTLSCKEMVPLVPHSSHVQPLTECTQKKLVKQTTKEKLDELKQLREEVDKFKSMNKYCCQQMTHYLGILQECMMHQKLEHEDDMFISLAGLKRVRDIMKGGTVGFYMEMNDNEDAIAYKTSEKFDFVTAEKSPCEKVSHVMGVSADKSQCDNLFNIETKQCQPSQDDEITAESSLAVAKKELCKLFLRSLNESSNTADNSMN